MMTKTVLPDDFQPASYHVLCGRGKECFESVGNRRFRLIVQMNLERYSQSRSKSDKSHIVGEIVDIIRESGGGFVAKDKKSGRWIEISDAMAREKVGALFRDFLHSQYRSSAKSKTARRRANRIQQARTLEPKMVKIIDYEDDDCTVATECSNSSMISCDFSECSQLLVSLIEPIEVDYNDTRVGIAAEQMFAI